MTPYLPANLGFMPLIGVMTFLISTIALFFLGPFDWPIRNHESLALFLIGAMVTISSGYTMGVTAPSRTGELTYWRQLYVLGALSSCIMIFPSAYVYTGKMPWEAFDALFDQGQAYRDFLARITELDGQRGPVVLARTLTHWMIYAVIPIAVFRWRRLNLVMRLLLAGTIVSAACFSLLRGTDQGTFDLVYIFAVSICVVIARSCLRSGRTIGSLLTSGVGMATIGLAVVMIAAALYVFTERKVGRYDGRIETLCFGEDQQICVNDRHPVAAELSEKDRFAFAMVTAYATMGYYGLALSLERDFDSTLGVGHSSALTRLYEVVTGDTKHYERSFTYRLRQDGWSDLYMWSSMYTWIANDVGFLLTLPVVGLLAWLWGASWRDAVRGDSDAAGIVFCMLTQTFMYSPANLQLSLVMDTYVALLIWLWIWFYTTGRVSCDRPPSAQSPHGASA